MEPSEPVNLTEALRSFDDVYSPRIVATMYDNDVRIAHTKGEIPDHVDSTTSQVLPSQLDDLLRVRWVHGWRKRQAAPVRRHGGRVGSVPRRTNAR